MAFALTLALRYWRVLALAGGLLAFTGGYFAWRAHERDIGAEDVRQEVQKQVEVNRAEGIEGARDVRDCASRDLVWDLKTRSCVEP